MGTPPPMRSSLIGLVALVALAGCGQSGERDDVRATVTRFYDALAQARTDEACSQLSSPAAEQLESESGEPCERAVVSLRRREAPTVAAVRVYITSAQVSVGGGESAFLDREPDGWKLSAIGCAPREGAPTEVPLDCELEG